MPSRFGKQWLDVERVVTHYSGATVPDFHGIPYSLLPDEQKHHVLNVGQKYVNFTL